MSQDVFAYVLKNWKGFLQFAVPASHRDDFVWMFDISDATPLSFENGKLTIAAAGDAYAAIVEGQRDEAKRRPDSKDEGSAGCHEIIGRNLSFCMCRDRTSCETATRP